MAEKKIDNGPMESEYPEKLIHAPVFLLGMPRSGTTWLSQIFESSPHVLMRLSPNYSYPLKNMLNEASSKSDWMVQLRAALNTDDPFMTQNWRREKGELEWIKKSPEKLKIFMIKDTRFHSLYQKGMELFPLSKCLFVVRNPCAQLNSWMKSKEFPKDASFAANWRSGACRKSEGPGEYWGFDDWKALTREFLELEQQSPKRYKVFRYEDLVANPAVITKILFEFIDLEFDARVESFLARSHATHDRNVYSVFRSPRVAEQWREEFPKSIASQIYTELSGTEYERFL